MRQREQFGVGKCGQMGVLVTEYGASRVGPPAPLPGGYDVPWVSYQAICGCRWLAESHATRESAVEDLREHLDTGHGAYPPFNYRPYKTFFLAAILPPGVLAFLGFALGGEFGPFLWGSLSACLAVLGISVLQWRWRSYYAYDRPRPPGSREHAARGGEPPTPRPSLLAFRRRSAGQPSRRPSKTGLVLKASCSALFLGGGIYDVAKHSGDPSSSFLIAAALGLWFAVSLRRRRKSA